MSTVPFPEVSVIVHVLSVLVHVFQGIHSVPEALSIQKKKWCKVLFVCVCVWNHVCCLSCLRLEALGLLLLTLAADPRNDDHCVA